MVSYIYGKQRGDPVFMGSREVSFCEWKQRGVPVFVITNNVVGDLATFADPERKVCNWDCGQIV